MFVCISFMCLRVLVDLIQPLAARNNKRCCCQATKFSRLLHRTWSTTGDIQNVF